MEYACVLGDADRASDPEPQDHSEDPVEAVEREAAGSLVDLSNGPPVDAMVRQTAKLLMRLNHQEIDYVFRKTLTEKDTTIESLRISKSQAALLFSSFSRESFTFTVSGSSGTKYIRSFKMRDENKRNYNEMKFVGYLGKKVNRNTSARITCEIKGQWRGFVRQNRLKKGDDVCIYRNLLVEDHFIFKVARNRGN